MFLMTTIYLGLSYRTILDVNIDTFEWKPWRYPGVDITDFFNFGFDEESWKSYCKSLVLVIYLFLYIFSM